MCNTTVYSAKDKCYRKCNRKATFIVTKFENGEIVKDTCCKQHKQKSIENLLGSKDKEYVFGTGYFDIKKAQYLYTNTIINTYTIGDEHLESVIDTHMFNTKSYGPHNKSYYENKWWMDSIY